MIEVGKLRDASLAHRSVLGPMVGPMDVGPMEGVAMGLTERDNEHMPLRESLARTSMSGENHVKVVHNSKLVESQQSEIRLSTLGYV